MWLPNIDSTRRPVYLELVRALTAAIHDRTVHPGDRLPSHRELAYRLRITVATVTKAFAVAEHEGLIVSRVGRGTYAICFPEKLLDADDRSVEIIDLRANAGMLGDVNNLLNRALGAISRRKSLHSLLEYHPTLGTLPHRATGSHWMRLRGVKVSVDDVLVCESSREALIAILAMLAGRDQIILTENLNIPGIREAAELFGLRLRGLPTDAEGLRPDTVAAACEEGGVTAIVCSPTMHDPTNTTMGLERRHQIIKIARDFGCVLLENDSSGHLSGDTTPTITQLAPDICVYLCGTYKSVAPGLRVGFIGCPPNLTKPIHQALHSMSWAACALMGELTSVLINDGTGTRLLAMHRKEAGARMRIAAEILKRRDIVPTFPSYHFWLPLPARISASAFSDDLKNRGVLVHPAQDFALNEQSAPNALRVALGGVRDRPKLIEALTIIAEQLHTLGVSPEERDT